MVGLGLLLLQSQFVGC